MIKKKKIAFHTLGCKLNYAETSTISRDIDINDFDIVDFRDVADYYVINTCLVTASAEKKCIASVKQAHKRNPDAGIAVVGCYSQLKPEKLSSIEGVTLILGNAEKFSLGDYLNGRRKSEDLTLNFKPETLNSFEPSYSANDRTRSFLKVQDGCDYFCSYCIIPIARGRSRSALIEDVIKNAHEIAATGIKEVVLTGVNIGDFGKHNKQNLLQLIAELDKVNGIERYRISSIEPELLTDDIISFVAASPKFLPHFHLPLQSGSDKILKLMHRKYDTALFIDRLTKIKKAIPDCMIAADVILGFQGETDEDFRDTFKFIEDNAITYAHIFPYSEREGTYALRLDGKVPANIKKQRCHELQVLSDHKKLRFYEQFKGSVRKVLFESDNDHGTMYGFTDNYIKVKTPFNESLINQIKEVNLLEIDEDCVYSIVL